jgi:hypothetical protein
MEKVEALKIQIKSLNKNEIEDLLIYIKNIENEKNGGLLNNLKEIKIDAPKDFSSNIDNFLYTQNSYQNS